MASLIVGARTEEQLDDSGAAANLRLSADEVERLDKVSAQPLPYLGDHGNAVVVGCLV